MSLKLTCYNTVKPRLHILGGPEMPLGTETLIFRIQKSKQNLYIYKMNQHLSNLKSHNAYTKPFFQNITLDI